jgi:regulator of sigma E protease
MLSLLPSLLHGSLLPSTLRSLAAFAIVLGVLVFFHELGHYLAARWRGVHVETFSIGFGRKIFGWRDRHGTEWRIAWLPLGGFVKLHGQEQPEEVSEETKAAWIAGRTFHEKPVISRAIVVAAGPIANFVLAFVLFAALFAVAGRPVVEPVVGEVMAGSAAAKAGLVPGDRILAIDGAPVARFLDLQRIITAHPATTLDLTLLRDGASRHLAVTTGSHLVDGREAGLLGISGGSVRYERLSLPGAVAAGASETWLVLTETVDGVWQMVSGQRGTDDLGGPLRIAQLSGQVAATGLANLISFIAVLSINLGLVNLFPIPVLDGGHLLFYLAEAIIGRPLPKRAQDYGFRAGIALLVGLFVFATWNDLANLGIFRWVAHLAG